MPDNNHTSEQSPMKVCTQCGELKPATPEFFTRHKSCKGGLRAHCKVCQREKGRQYREENIEKIRESDRRYREENREVIHERQFQWREANREAISERDRQWRKANPEYHRKYHEENSERIRKRVHQWQKANPEKVRESRQKRHKANPEKNRERQRRYRIANADKIRESNRRWRKANPDKELAKIHRRRARKLKNGGTFTADDIKAIYKSQEGRCWWCQCEVGDTYHIDHRIPLSRGGSNAPENLCIACPQCNMSKGSKMPHEFNGRLF